MINKIFEILALIQTNEVAPKSLNNITLDFGNKNMLFAEEISVVGIIIVFAALAILATLIGSIAKVLKLIQLKRMEKKGEVIVSKSDISNVTDEINVVIALALNRYFEEIHDLETAILTIHREPRPYSPWSSKIYNIRRHL